MSYQQSSGGQPIFRAKGEYPSPQPVPSQAVNGPLWDAPPAQGQSPEQLPAPKGTFSANPPQGLTQAPPPGVPIYGVPADAGPLGPGGPAYPGPAVVPGGPVPVYPEHVVVPSTTAPTWWTRPVNGGGPLAIPHFYARAEYLAWRLNRDSTPPLVTASNASAAELIASGNPGALGNPLTPVIIGGDLNNPTFSGGKLTIGGGNFAGLGFGVEGSLFVLGRAGSSYFASANTAGQPSLFSPVFLGTVPAAEIVGFPGVTQGNIEVEHSTRLWGAELNARHTVIASCTNRLDVLAGFRYLNLRENLTITREANFLTAGGVDGVAFFDQDSFSTQNRFYLGQVGLDYEFRPGRWILGASAKVGLGWVHQSATLSGSSAVPDVGLLVQGSNSGQHSQNRFAVVPELGLKVGYQITQNVSVYAGYTLLFLNDVIRPGGQVDLTLNPAAGRPAIPLSTTHLWAQGLNLGVELRF
jgi:hypothetical protein